MKFNNYTEFYNAIKDLDTTHCPTLKFFLAAVSNINVGCGCTKKTRTAFALSKYEALVNDLTEYEKDVLSIKFGKDIEFLTDSKSYGKI